MITTILTAYDGAILGPIAKVLGKILEGIYYVLSMVGIENTGICIILFTFIVNGLMLPLQIKQQKFAKMSSIMNPEIQEIQKKYKNKKDQASQQKMSMETQAVYQKYGVSPASGCLPLLITFPILFALYRVIYNIPAYVGQVYDIYAGLADSLHDAGVTVEQLAEYLSNPTYVVTTATKNAADNPDEITYFIDVLGQFNDSAWNKLAGDYSNLKDSISTVKDNASHINYFLGLNLSNHPSYRNFSISIPILSVVTQIISTRLGMAGQTQQNTQDNPTMSSMKTMNTVMPFITGLMCFMFPIGVGLYWVTGNVFRILQALGINIYFKRIDMDAEMKKNMEKSKKRMERMGIDSNKVMNNTAAKKKNSPLSKQKEEKKPINAAEVTKDIRKKQVKRQNNTKYKDGSIGYYANILDRNQSESNGKK